MTVSMIACTVTAGRYRLGEKSMMKRGFIFGSFIVVHRFGTWDFPLGGGWLKPLWGGRQNILYAGKPLERLPE